MNGLQSQVKIVAWLHFALGCIGLLGAILIALFAGFVGAIIGGGATGHAAGGFLGFLGVGGLAFMVAAVFSAPNFLVAWGLLNGAEWARIVGIIVSILSLIHPSFGLGTAVAIYSLIVLFSSDVEQLFRRSA